MTTWRAFCMEKDHPGLWRRWHRNQVVTGGWAAAWGFHLEGPTKKTHGWPRARSALARVRVGDHIVVHLPDNRVGRIGEVTGKTIADDEWDPLVPPGPELEDGEQGRQLLVRWLPVGPEDPDVVIQLPKSLTLGRTFLCGMNAARYRAVAQAVDDERNWVPLTAGRFAYERSLSNYIASFPDHLEDGLQEYPYAAVREAVFPDRSRSDVLLIDRDETPVVVECKQHAPTPADVRQLRGYMRHVRRKSGRRKVRGILVHGGARRLSEETRAALRKERTLPVETRRYSLDVDFSPSD